jgi:hypothetical protein
MEGEIATKNQFGKPSQTKRKEYKWQIPNLRDEKNWRRVSLKIISNLKQLIDIKEEQLKWEGLNLKKK